MPKPTDFQRLKIAIRALPKSSIRKMTEEIIAEAEEQARKIESEARAYAEEKTRDPVLQQKKLQILSELISRFPPSSSVEELINQAEVAAATGRSIEETITIEQNVLSLFQPEEFGMGTLPEERELKTPSSTRSEGETTVASMSTQAPQTSGRGRPASQQPPFPTSYEDISNMEWKWAKPYIKQIIDDDDFDSNEIQWGPARNFSGLSKGNLPETNLRDLLDDFLSQKQPIFRPPTGKGVGSRPRRIQGKGVNMNRTHAPTTRLTSGGNYRFTPKVDKTKKVEKVPSYMEFGSHLIHQHDLIGGVLKMRHKSGAAITEIPTQAIGGKLKKVLLTLTGSGSPSFEDINELSEKDKALLNKVVKKAKIDQRLLVPTPDKTKEEQDMNKLQILSGEIQSGNNNPQLVKELKVLLLRLKNGGRIPKRQAHEIMEDLLSLGY